ncbi:MAG: 30S ribosomal protein S17 [Candidatus Thermoplasmatota archaeon]|nr:30S ribosomal protein S17 [Candidatus Thermoplasmatota archaeon]
MTIKTRNIGIGVKPPESTCNDSKCPFHGSLSVRGQIIECVVVSDKMTNTAVVEREYYKYLPKYERYEKRTARYSVHNPPCINAKVGAKVKIMECRPLAKTVSFVIVEKK